MPPLPPPLRAPLPLPPPTRTPPSRPSTPPSKQDVVLRPEQAALVGPAPPGRRRIAGATTATAVALSAAVFKVRRNGPRPLYSFPPQSDRLLLASCSSSSSPDTPRPRPPYRPTDRPTSTYPSVRPRSSRSRSSPCSSWRRRSTSRSPTRAGRPASRLRTSSSCAGCSCTRQRDLQCHHIVERSRLGERRRSLSVGATSASGLAGATLPTAAARALAEGRVKRRARNRQSQERFRTRASVRGSG